MTKSDTVRKALRPKNAFPWGREDCIRWIEWRTRELTVKDGKYTDERALWLLEKKAADGRHVGFGDALADYAIWLLKVRDGLTRHQIVYQCFPKADERIIETLESRVRRRFMKVERNHPGSAHFVPHRLTKQEKFMLEIAMTGVM